MNETSSPSRSYTGWIAGGVGVLAVAALVIGLATLLPPDRASKTQDGGSDNVPANVPVKGEKPPTEYHLPLYAGGFGFHSMEAKDGHGSSSYSLKEGDSAAVSQFYRNALEKNGWKLLWQTKATEQPGSPNGKALAAAHGRRLRWRNEAEHRQLTLLCLDFPQNGSTGQVLLTWSPL